MSIIGIGTEIVECLRIRRMIERHGEQFLCRVYTSGEIRFAQESRHTTEQFATRWAAKAAVFKSLGLRWRRGMAWTDVEIRCEADGRVLASLNGNAREIARERGADELMVTVAHCRAYATATCVAIKTNSN